MVIYTKEEKRIIIPEGLGGYVTGDCRAIAEEAREQGYESGYTQGYNDGVLADCGEAIEEAFNDGFQSGYTQGQADCPECSGGTCNLEAGVLNLLGDGPTWSMSPSVGYDGWNSLTVNDMGYGDGKYNEGYEAGLEACSGGTCNLENGQVGLGREWDGDDTIYPSQGNDGFSSFHIYDNGYGNEKYQSGYTQGYNDGQGGGCNLQNKSVYQNSNLVTYYPDEGYDGMSSIYVDATGVYGNGHTDGQNYARSLMTSSAFTANGTYTNPDGWNSVTVDVPAPPILHIEKRFNLESGDTSPWTVRPDWTTYMTEAIITDNGYGQGKYTEGYEAGLQACSGGTLVAGDFGVSDLWGGDTTVYPSQGEDGYSSFRIYDNGYGSHKYNEGYGYGYDEGYQSGSTDGYTDGFNEGYLSGASDTCGNSVQEAYEIGYQSGTTDGFNDGHSSGYTDGYDAGQQDGYAQGYNDGQAACPTCPQGEIYNVELDSGWTGFSDILPAELINEITITDNGYSEAKYNEGYSQGYSDGYNDGAADCSIAVEQAYESGYTAGEGEIHTLEIVIKTENNYYEAFTGDTRITMVLDEGEGVPAHTTPYDPANIIEGDGIDEYMGTYYFNTQDSDDPSLYYISQIYDTTAKTLTLCFKGYLYNNSGVYPQPIYGCPSSVGVEIMASNISSWGNWSVETVRFNGRPLYDNHGWLSKIGNGGFKLKPTYYEDNPAVLNNHRQIFIITY